jgi:uncharacterized protein (DUF58 family)
MWLQRIFRPKKTNYEKTKQVSKGEKTKHVLIPAKALRQLDRLYLRGSRELRGESMGQRPSFRRKPTSDFREHRMYVPGDDMRFVDWRASARHEQVFIKQGELPKDVTVYLLLDCSGSMLWGEAPKNRAQLQLAAALGYLALIHRDRLMVYPYGEVANQPLGPVTGRGQIPFYLKYLSELRYGGGANLKMAVKTLTRRISWGGLMFVLSDLLDDDLTDSLEYLPAPSWWVNVIHLLHPQEIDPDLQGAMEMIDCETGQKANYDVTKEAVKIYRQRMEEWQSSLDLDCVKNHAFYTLAPTNWSLEREMIAHLRSVQVVSDQ